MIIKHCKLSHQNILAKTSLCGSTGFGIKQNKSINLKKTLLSTKRLNICAWLFQNNIQQCPQHLETEGPGFCHVLRPLATCRQYASQCRFFEVNEMCILLFGISMFHCFAVDVYFQAFSSVKIYIYIYEYTTEQSSSFIL